MSILIAERTLTDVPLQVEVVAGVAVTDAAVRAVLTLPVSTDVPAQPAFICLCFKRDKKKKKSQCHVRRKDFMQNDIMKINIWFSTGLKTEKTQHMILITTASELRVPRFYLISLSHLSLYISVRSFFFFLQRCFSLLRFLISAHLS